MAKKRPNGFGGRLRSHRETVGYTQSELADLVGLQRLTIHRYEVGLYDPAWSVVTELAAALGLTPNDFLDD